VTPLLLLAASLAAPDGLALAWLREGRVETRASSPSALATGVPLGSAWKLFVYAYAVDEQLETPDYRCGSPLRKGEEYCCAAGGSVARDRALAQSCGLFFAPERLKIDKAAWEGYWRGRGGPGASWLSDLGKLRPETRLDPTAVLAALAAVPEGPRRQAERALLPVAVETQGVAAALGGRLRVKTYTWDHPLVKGASFGGGAGWLVDGTPVWFGGTGSSRQVLKREAARLASWLPSPRGAEDAEACVVVDYFAQYPLASVDHLPGGEPASPGPLRGLTRVRFQNGNVLTFRGEGELLLRTGGDAPRIEGRLGLTEYVARVLDREADPGATEAARALAVVVRTWLRQNAPFERGCFHASDSTRMQRVSPSSPTQAALQAAYFADGLVLQGAPVRYALEAEGGGVLGWKAAVREASSGARFDQILAGAFPGTTLAAETGEVECRRLPDVESWLLRASSRWERRLSAEPGFEPPEGPLTVCALDAGNPYSDRERLRVYVRGFATRESRITLAHEYLHLALRFHPSGQDEDYVERLARTLAEE
jgi:uncharacterized protein YfaQ (DUF2300 family)